MKAHKQLYHITANNQEHDVFHVKNQTPARLKFKHVPFDCSENKRTSAIGKQIKVRTGEKWKLNCEYMKSEYITKQHVFV